MNWAFIILLLLYAVGLGANMADKNTSTGYVIGTMFGYCLQISLIYWAIKIGF